MADAYTEAKMTEDFVGFISAFGGLNGFEMLRKYIKQSNEMCRTVTSILQDRVELEHRYSRGLASVGARLLKTSSLCLGTMETAWRAVATSMMDEAEGHKCVADSIDENVLQPIKNLSESFHKSRKPIEVNVEKVSRALQNLRAEETRTKRNAFSSAKDLAKTADAAANSRVNAKGASEKELAKVLLSCVRQPRSRDEMEKKCRTLEDTVRKAEKEYYDNAMKAEVSRLDWEATVYKSCAQLQVLEVDRLKQCHEVMKKYHRNVNTLASAYNATIEKMQTSIRSVSIRDDMQALVEQRGVGPSQPEQLLVDFFAEDLTVTMDRDRREHFLKGYHAFTWQDIDREKRSREGIEKLLSVYKGNPKFCDADNQEEIRHKLISSNAMIAYLEACQYKFNCSLAVMQKMDKPHHRLSSFLEFTKDKHGLPQTILRLPSSEGSFLPTDGYVSVAHRQDPSGSGDGHTRYAQIEEFDDDFDEEFDGPAAQASPIRASVASSNYSARQSATVPVTNNNSASFKATARAANHSGSHDIRDSRASLGGPVIGWCKAVFAFDARDDQELSLKPGDMVSVYRKANSEWWEGELHGRAGLFPANYVEEF